MLSYERMRRSERILDMHAKARDAERAGPAHDRVIADADTYWLEPATCRAHVVRKFKDALPVAGDGPEWLEPRLRSLMPIPRRIDGAWLRALRDCLADIENYVADPGRDANLDDYERLAYVGNSESVADLLRSILAGMSGPRPL